MNTVRILLSTAVLALAGDGAAADISISPGELDNLGVRFEAPTSVTAVPGIEATARVTIPPAGDAIVGTPQAGLLVGVNVAAGDSAEEGQVLAELRSAEFIELQREFLDAFNTYLLVQNELERDKQLHDDGIISARRLQETSTRHRIAEAGVNEHRQLLKIAGLAKSEIRLLEREQRLIETLRITAPFSGVIIERMATTGQRLDAMSPIYRLADLSELWLEIGVPREHAPAIASGMRVVVTGHGSEPSATVTTIGRAIDPTTQFVVVRARLDADSHGLSPGQFEAVRIVAIRADTLESGTLAIPVAAVTSSGRSRFVFVRSNGGIDVREVDVISSYADRAYVAVGLDSQDQLAISGISALKALWIAQGDPDSP